MSNMREISIEECNAVSGGSWGTDDAVDEIIVTGTKKYYDSLSDNMFTYGGLAGYDTIPAAGQGLSLLDEFKEFYKDNNAWLAKLFGYDLINSDHQKALNAQMNDKQKTQVGTYHFSDGTKWDFVDTADGVRYYDRNSDGKADLAVRDTAFGVETDTGDGSGWSMPVPN